LYSADEVSGNQSGGEVITATVFPLQLMFACKSWHFGLNIKEIGKMANLPNHMFAAGY